MNIIQPINNIMLENATCVDEVIDPLKKLGINFFSLTRVFDDGSRIDLNNRADMADEFYYGKENFWMDYEPEVEPQQIDDQIMLLDNTGSNCAVEFLKKGCDIDHMCVTLNKRKGYVDVCNFGTSSIRSKTNETYLSNLPLLKSFYFYFIEKFQKVIKEFEKTPIILPKAASAYEEKKVDDATETINLPITRFYYGNSPQNYFTRRQFECCYWLYKGKSPEELALIMEISVGSVRNLIEKIRDKMGCDHIYQLFYRLREFCFFEKYTNHT